MEYAAKASFRKEDLEMGYYRYLGEEHARQRKQM